MLHIKSLFTFFVALLWASVSNGRVPQPSNQPKVILVQLRVEQNRVSALTQHQRTDMLRILEKDREKVNQAMINDFTDNLHYCPVYYFMDTNYEAVKNKNFTGILLNADLSVVKEIPLDAKSTDYLVVCYGKPTMQRPSEEVVEDSIAAKRNSDIPNGEGIIIFDDKLRQISYLYKLGFDDLFIKRRFDKKYYYKSKEFTLEYAPFATLLNQKLQKDPTHIPITRIWQK